MKLNYIYRLVQFLLVVVVTLSSCSKMNDLHDVYLQEGEKIYVGKPDSAEVFAGMERVKLRYWVSDPKAEKLIVYWLSRTDSMVFDIPSHLGKDSIDLIISDLPEYNYSFELVTTNKEFGNRSTTFQTSGSAYGDRFQASLLDRVIASSKYVNREEVQITWLGAVERGISAELVYTNKEGKRITRIVPMTEKVTVIDDYQSDMEYKTLFLPEVTAIDTFYTASKVIDVEKPPIALDKSLFVKWNPDGIPYTQYSDDDSIDKLWDNTTSKYYLYKTPSGFPHSFTFDMGQTVKLSQFMHWQRPGVGIQYRIQNVKKFQLWGSDSPNVTDDFAGWVKLGDFEIKKPSGLPWGNDSAADAAQAAAGDTFVIDPAAPPVRYIRYVVEDSWDGAQGIVVVGEMTFFEPF